MNIVFTGHRNKGVSLKHLDAINSKHPNSVWIHGGAEGFDSQVSNYAKTNDITEIVIKPNYKNHHYKKAPLIRNKQMLSYANLLVACYDGRKSGGTYYTIKNAKLRNIETVIIEPLP